MNSELVGISNSIGNDAVLLMKISKSLQDINERVVLSSSLNKKQLEEMTTFTNKLKDINDIINVIIKARESIINISKTIDDISKQMHILSLNGQIEAAREQSKPFNIISINMRKLSDKIKEENKFISPILNDLYNNISSVSENTKILLTDVDQLLTDTMTRSNNIDVINNNMEKITAMIENLSTSIHDESIILSDILSSTSIGV